jgi:crossover junction endodeoxyribonuclease RuvC
MTLLLRERALASTALFLGIDLGVSGCAAVVTASGELVFVNDVPTLNDGPKGRRTINATLWAQQLAETHAIEAFVETVGPRPGEGVVQSFSFGRARGLAEGILATLSIPTTFIAPAVWKRCIGIAPGKAGAKDAARSEACRRWPQHAGLFSRVKDADRAESALIAISGLMLRK